VRPLHPNGLSTRGGGEGFLTALSLAAQYYCYYLILLPFLLFSSQIIPCGWFIQYNTSCIYGLISFLEGENNRRRWSKDNCFHADVTFTTKMFDV
jgi:hypothetical protein